MKTTNKIIKTLLGAVLSLLVTFGITQHAAAERIVFYAPVIATTVSRGGQRVTYTTNSQIMTMNVDGTDVRQLTTGTEDSKFPAWRPGQAHILFQRGTTLYVMDANGGGTFAVGTFLGPGADWSPDGKMVCYVGQDSTGSSGLLAVSVDPSAKGNKKVGAPILVCRGVPNIYGPVWSPDGTKIAFGAGASPHITVLDLITGNLSSLDSMHGLLPSWSPDGNQIAFVSGANMTGYWQLLIMNSDFSGITQVTDYNISVLWPTWSPDGTQMAFRLGSGQGWDASLYKLTLDTGELSLLREKADHPDWAP